MDNAQIYVGTYAKYNNGSIEGKWLKLTDYSSYDDFMQACSDLHSDEDDPELMFQDHEGIPGDLVGESFIDPAFWDLLDTIQSSHLDSEVFEAAMELGIEVDEVEDKYQGQYDSDSDFAYELAEQTGAIDTNVQWPYTCIDWEHAANELMYDFQESNGHYFSSY